MLSRNKIKLINSLSQKKGRDKLGLFVAEGVKLVTDLLPYFDCAVLIYTDKLLLNEQSTGAYELIEASRAEYKKISHQEHPQGLMGVFIKNDTGWEFESINKTISLALDDVQDPGNLGTIVRIADWFGICDVFCSKNTADIYNPKTIQASMGALARVRVHYVDLHAVLTDNRLTVPVYGTFLDGENIYQTTISNKGIIVMGNEGNGISTGLKKIIDKKLLIPNYPEGIKSSESLNVSAATAIVCAEFRRRQKYIET
ncbi:MAG: RNA methyltransferase [Prevotellaceae bacterium]|jgi:TrmH family RNA methyltransferase|nr:RNA methyltransferase [Prevotellaceae bacterium]